jgi:cobyric acid synthase
MKKIAMLVALLVLAGGMQAFADTIVYNDPAGQGTQNYPGLNLANFFTVTSPIIVDAMGVFNASGSGYITGSIQVGIAEVDPNTGLTTPVAPTIVTFHGQFTPQGLGTTFSSRSRRSRLLQDYTRWMRPDSAARTLMAI